MSMMTKVRCSSGVVGWRLICLTEVVSQQDSKSFSSFDAWSAFISSLLQYLIFPFHSLFAIHSVSANNQHQQCQQTTGLASASTRVKHSVISPKKTRSIMSGTWR